MTKGTCTNAWSQKPNTILKFHSVTVFWWWLRCEHGIVHKFSALIFDDWLHSCQKFLYCLQVTMGLWEGEPYVLVNIVLVFTLVQLPLQSCSVQRKWRLFRSGNLKAAKVAPNTCNLSLEPLPSCGIGCMAGKMSSSIGHPHSSSRRCEVSPVPSCATQSVTWVPNPAETHNIHLMLADPCIIIQFK